MTGKPETLSFVLEGPDSLEHFIAHVFERVSETVVDVSYVGRIWEDEVEIDRCDFDVGHPIPEVVWRCAAEGDDDGLVIASYKPLRVIRVKRVIVPKAECGLHVSAGS